MNRKVLKETARQHVREAQGSPKRVTLVFLLLMVALVVLRFVLVELVGKLDFGGNYLSQALSSEAKVMAISYVVAFGMQFLMSLLCIGYTAVAMDIKEGTKIAPSSLLAGFHKGGRSVLACVLMELFLALWASLWSVPVSYILAMVLMTGGEGLSQSGIVMISLIYVAVALVILSYRYRMLFFILMSDMQVTARQALRKASTMTRGHRWQLFCLDLSFLPWMLLSALTCGVLLIWKLPYMVTTYAVFYDTMLEDYQKKQQKMAELREQILNQRPEC